MATATTQTEIRLFRTAKKTTSRFTILRQNLSPCLEHFTGTMIEFKTSMLITGVKFLLTLQITATLLVSIHSTSQCLHGTEFLTLSMRCGQEKWMTVSLLLFTHEFKRSTLLPTQRASCGLSQVSSQTLLELAEVSFNISVSRIHQVATSVLQTMS